jgi:predicted site-specific integrase-resolvase
MARRKTYLTVSKAAAVLDIAAGTLITLTNAGRIPCERNEANHRIYDADVISAEKARRDAKRIALSRVVTG